MARRVAGRSQWDLLVPLKQFNRIINSRFFRMVRLSYHGNVGVAVVIVTISPQSHSPAVLGARLEGEGRIELC